jgi:hypothetical protein
MKIFKQFGLSKSKNQQLVNTTKPEDVLSGHQQQIVEIWYYKHRHYVHKLVASATTKCPPTLKEDKDDPSLWKAEHWNWFLDYYSLK